MSSLDYKMFSALLLNNFKTSIFCLLSAAFLARILWIRFHPGLASIPGPVLAKWTKLWRLHDVYKGQSHHTAIRLHQEFGPLVRIAPNVVSVSDPHAISLIYGSKSEFTKTAFYPIQSISWQKKPQMNLFSTRDPHYHREQKRKVAGAYSMTSLLESEPAVDTCITLFMQRLGEMASERNPVHLGTWLEYYAFDVVGEVTFGKKLGFLQQGSDVDDMMKTIGGILVYASLCGQVPELHPFLLGNPLFPILIPAMESWNGVLNFTLKAINSRTAIVRDGELLDQANGEVGKDMLSRWLAVKSKDPLKIGTRDVIVHLSANVFAGSGTTAIAMRTAIYYLLRNPDTMKRLVSEIDAADREGKLSTPITYRESTTHLPYVGAVVKEALRIHPSVGLLMERHVPAGGIEICGKHIPGGTIVGINPWVLHHDPKVYKDPSAFIPERWINSSAEVLKRMEQSFFAFGAGSRTCIGKNISLMEIEKVIPQLVREYTIELAEPQKTWKTQNNWFVHQSDLVCLLSRRRQF